MFCVVDPLSRKLVGVSSENEPKAFEEFTASEHDGGTRQRTEHIPVNRGQHFCWQFTAEYERSLFFGGTLYDLLTICVISIICVIFEVTF